MEFPPRRDPLRGADEGAAPIPEAEPRSELGEPTEPAPGVGSGEPEIPSFAAAPAGPAAPPADPTPGRRFGGRRRGARSETVSRVLWVLPWLVFAITVVAVGGPLFALAMIGLSWIALGEFFRMTARAKPLQPVAFAAAAAMVIAAHLGGSFQVLLVAVAFFPVMLAFALLRPTLQNITWAFAVTVFGVVWIGLPFAHAVLLRDLTDHGAALLVNVLVATFFADTFAYMGGRWFGQRPLAPMISPNKTVEGLLIGVAGGTLGFWLAGLYQDWLSGPEALLFGFCIALLAPLGDLFESAIKRDLEVKDTGRILGPHGGLLDRLDAVLFTVVAGYYLALAIVL